MKEKKFGVSKIIIQMGDKETTLTVEQARELQAALNELLGETVIEKHYPQWIYSQPATYPPYVTYGTITTTGGTQNYGSATINLNDGNPLLV